MSPGDFYYSGPSLAEFQQEGLGRSVKREKVHVGEVLEVQSVSVYETLEMILAC